MGPSRPDLRPGDSGVHRAHRETGVWVFSSAAREGSTVRSRAEESESRLKLLGHRELDLVSRLSVLYERAELFPREVTARQVSELNRKLDEIRAEIDRLRAEEPSGPEGR